MIDTIVTIIKNQYDLNFNNNKWCNSPFKNIEFLTCDRSGKIGEIFLHEFCKTKYIEISDYQDDKISKNGCYDLIIKNFKIEVKTSRLGNNNTFQHENLHSYGCDFYCFIDISPDCFYITFLPSFDMSKKIKCINKKPHLRKNSKDIFKLDFSLKNINLLIKNKYCIKCISEKELQDFIHNSISYDACSKVIT